MNAMKLFRLFTVVSMLGILLGSPFRVQAEVTTGSIAGIVTDTAGNPLQYIPIVFYNVTGDFGDATCTNEEGEFAFTDLPLDAYILEAAGTGVHCGVDFLYAREYWQNAPFEDTATPIDLINGPSMVTGINFILERGGTISGTVRDINGNPITNGRISVALNLEDYSFPTEIYACTNEIDNNGAYTLKHIPLGVNYKVSAMVFPCPDNLSGYGTITAWPDSPTMSGGNVLSPTISEPDLVGIDFYLREIGDTPAGTDVLTFTSTGFITFDSVDVSGTTTLEPIVSDPTPVPPNFQTLGDYYELSTTAEFNNAQVCFHYDEGRFNAQPESAIRLLHKENFVWVDVTDAGYPNTQDNVVCGTVSSFSPFVVARALHTFSGFFQPVDNLPTINLMKAGSTIPVKFSLGGDQGLDIFEAGYPKSQAVDCDSTAPVDGIEETITAGSSGLAYDASTDQYTYGWKTDKSWANTCRQLVLKLDDGTFQRATFKFK